MIADFGSGSARHPGLGVVKGAASAGVNYQFLANSEADRPAFQLPRYLSSIAFVILLWAFVPVPPVKGDQTATANLTLQIQEQMEMTMGPSSVVLKIRLSPRVTAKIWASDVCAKVPESATILQHSGTYEISIQTLQTNGGSNACLRSSDGILEGSVPIRAQLGH